MDPRMDLHHAGIIDPQEFEQQVLERFDGARKGGASEHTALKLAAWLWLEQYGDANPVQATRSVRSLLHRRGRRLRA